MVGPAWNISTKSRSSLTVSLFGDEATVEVEYDEGLRVPFELVASAERLVKLLAGRRMNWPVGFDEETS